MPPQIKFSTARQIAKAVALLTILAPSLALGQQSWTIGPFHRPVTAPVITPNPQSVFVDPLRQQPVHWEASNTFNPAAVVRNGKIYVLTYTQWNRKSTSIGVATSKDLVHWTKYGPAFPLSDRPTFHSYKSSGIVTQLVDGRLVAAKIHGKFWMYWGEVEIHLATSPDLIHWTAIEDTKGDPVVLLKRRDDRFDSGFPEVGPPAVLTSKGIVLLYNGKNGTDHGAAGIDPGAYSVGEALFSTDDPAKLLARTDKPVFKPELPFERSGQYPTGTTFAEGLVFFKTKWFLYYGCADSFVGVAVTDRPAP